MQDENNALSYFDERMQLLGITEKENTVKLYQNGGVGKENVLVDSEVFKEVENGIFIKVYTLDRHSVNYSKDGSRWKNKEYGIVRLEKPLEKPNRDTIKYLMPKGEKVLPFFPPALLDKYEKGETIPVLYLTEGFFKAFKAQMHGIDCVGLPSITCMRDRETGKLHTDIHKLILRCNINRLVWLTDGDCRDITGKEITDGIEDEVHGLPYWDWPVLQK